MLDDGVYATVSEIGDAERINKSYVSRILRLALLAPDIIETVLEGRSDQAPMLEQLERSLPASWEQQRRRLFDDNADCKDERAQPAALSKVMPSKCRPRSRAWA
jgi:hypothetical protein